MGLLCLLGLLLAFNASIFTFLILEDCLESLVSSPCSNFTMEIETCGRKSRISSSSFNPPPVVSFSRVVTRFRGPESETTGFWNSIFYSISFILTENQSHIKNSCYMFKNTRVARLLLIPSSRFRICKILNCAPGQSGVSDLN